MRNDPLRIETLPGQREGTTILRLAGPLTLNNLSPVGSLLDKIEALRLILDLTGVDYIDSAGLGLLVQGSELAVKKGCAFLVVGANARVLTLLELTQVHSVLRLYPTLQEAEKALGCAPRHF